MQYDKCENEVRCTNKLRVKFLGTTSLYALLLTAPAAAQQASDNCSLPDISGIGLIPVPAATTQIFESDTHPTAQNPYFVSCASRPSIGYLFNAQGNIVAVNTAASTIDTTTVDGDIISAPNRPSFGIFATGADAAAIANFGQINSTGIAMAAGTVSGNLIGYNSGTLRTNFNIGPELASTPTWAPLAPGMILTSGAPYLGGIRTETSNNGTTFFVGGGNDIGGLNAGAVSAINHGSITTAGLSSPGLVAISAGGQGGMGRPDNANDQYVAVAVGGSGGVGGDGGTVQVQNFSTINTEGMNSIGIKALSVGGGGGAGGAADAQSTSTNLVSGSFSLAIGGNGGASGNGDAVTVELNDGSEIQTGNTSTNSSFDDLQLPLTASGGYVAGDHSPGVLAQSIGGGGGSGGHAVSMAHANGLVAVAVSVSKGGQGGAGGDGADVTVSTEGNTSIVTGGRAAGGIVAQSIGGGGGSGGTVNSQSDSTGIISANVSVAMGAAGGSGGSSGHVQVSHGGGAITTYGMHSTGIVAQSIAGGGGNGGNIVDGVGDNAPLAVSVNVNMGGDAGNGGTTGDVTVNVSGSASVTTYGDHAMGIVSQSIGGGGGNGGSVHSYSATTGGGSVADGLTGQHEDSLTFNSTVNIGGSGGTGAHSGSVTSAIAGHVETSGVGSTGVLLQSIGGGGGNGGHIHAYSQSVSVDTGSLSQDRINNSAITSTVNIGGAGSGGGDGGTVTGTLSGGTITTNQIRSSGLVAQSIGGGGGNGGATNSLDVTTSIPTNPSDFATRYAAFVPGSGAEVKGNLDVSVNIGGSSAGGGDGGQATILLDGGQITTLERQSHGAVAQSIGGGGGMGGHAVANGFVGIGTYSFNTALGGSGSRGGNGGAVSISNDQSGALSNIHTSGDQSYGLFAQSIGGGGGSGGAAHIDLASAPAALSNVTLGLTLGGSAGGGGNGSTVSVSDAVVATNGVQSHGVLAQSIGGGGGNASLSDGSGTIELNLGGSGGAGGAGGDITLQNIRATTNGALAAGMVAQSIGGGGGLAGVAGTNGLLNEAAQGSVTTAFTLNTHGSAGDAGAVFVGCQPDRTDQDCEIQVTTQGTSAAGIIAQSIGGGGSASFLNTGGNVHSAVAFDKGVGGSSGLITFTDENGGFFNISTSGDGAIGIVAQSIAGNGGALFTNGSLLDVSVTAGNTLSDGISGGLDFNLDATSISTSGDYAPGLFLLSGNSLFTVFAADGQKTYQQSGLFSDLQLTDIQVKNRLFLNRNSSISTSGTESHGLVMATHSYFGSTAAPSRDVSDRSLNIWIDGKITVSGTESWGVLASNIWDVSSTYPVPTAANRTTAFTLGEHGLITAGTGTAGGIKLSDSGNLLANINGIIDAGTGTAVDISAANTFLTVGDPTYSGTYQTYNGNIVVTATAAGGTNTITLSPRAILNGSVTSDTSVGATSNITISGTIDNLGADAITLGDLGANSTVWFNDVRGKISATFDEAGHTASVTNNYLMRGSIVGPIDYHMTAGATHTLDVDAANNSSDLIHVNSFSHDPGTGPDGNVAQISLYLTSLPTPEFQSVTIIDIANAVTGVDTTSQSLGTGCTPNALAPFMPCLTTQTHETILAGTSSYDLSDFNIDNDDNVIDYAYNASLQGTNFVVEITDITINLNQSALTGEAAQIAPLAQAHVDAIKNGSLVPDPTSMIYHTLLKAANAAEGTDGKFFNLSQTLGDLTGTALDPDAQSNSAAQRGATDSMHSCGGEQTASVNPVEQGECVWSSISHTNIELGNAGHDERSTNLAFGLQKAVGAKSYLGFAFGYDIADIDRTAASADTERLHAGAVYKYVDEDFFASTSLLASYSTTAALRVYSDVADASITHAAESKREALALASRFRAGYRMVQGAFDITPMVDVDLFLNHQFQYEESGTGGLETHAAATTNFLADVHPRIQLGTHFDVGGASVRLFGEVGQRFALNDPGTHVGLAHGLAGDFTVKVVQEREASLTSWGVGFVADLNENFEMRFSYEVTDGSLEKIEKLALKLAYKF